MVQVGRFCQGCSELFESPAVDQTHGFETFFASAEFAQKV